MKPQRENIKKLITAISHGLYEREHIISLTLLSAVAGESVFLLGLPGVAKSLIGRRLKLAFRDAASFEYLMSRFSTPDEIFGPVSISKLKDEDTYERIIGGYLPTADVIFLDEIWKAGPSIQNALLTVLNEKVYRNGRNEIILPLKGIIAASNELPASNEGLEALWDRFLIRIIVDGIQDEKAFNAMISATTEMQVEIDSSLQITDSQYRDWQKTIDTITIPAFVFDVISAIRKEINKLNIQRGKEELPPIIISDRRWKKTIRLLRTSAMLNQRETIEVSDILILPACMWDEEQQIKSIEDIVEKAIFGHLLCEWILRKDEIEIKIKELQEVAANGKDNEYILYEDKYYNIIGLNEGNTFISKELYESISSRTPSELVMTAVDREGNNFMRTPPKNTTVPKIEILKTTTGVKVNGRNFRLSHKSDFDQVDDPHFQEWLKAVSERAVGLYSDFRAFKTDIKKQFEDNLFIDSSGYGRIVDELRRFEMNLRKLLKLLGNER